eukprot:2235714-Pleurochrysis_carterae.AAC.5
MGHTVHDFTTSLHILREHTAAVFCATRDAFNINNDERHTISPGQQLTSMRDQDARFKFYLID